MSKKSTKKSTVFRKFLFGLKIALLVFLVLVIAGGGIFYFTYGKDILAAQKEAKKLVASSSADTFRASQTSVIYASSGKVITELKGEKDVYYLEYEDIPQVVVDAMISTEDKNFATHNGVDMKGVTRALWVLIKNKGKITQGASTITQQLSRNTFTDFLGFETSWRRKVREIFVALEMEKKYTKRQIMEFYLNNIYFANGHYGIQAASQAYFSKDVDELTLSEVAFLCAIPNSPNTYDPLVNSDRTVLRRDKILEEMLEEEKITQDEYDEACAQEIVLNPKTVKNEDYVVTYAKHCAVEYLMEGQGFTIKTKFDSDAEKEAYEEEYNELYSQCQQSLFEKGYRIYTTINMKKQKTLQNAVNTVLAGFTEKENGIYKLQGAAVCIDNNTGKVVAIVGGRKQKNTEGYTLNRAYQSYRQPGSSIKPLIVYTPSFERNYTPDTIVEDKYFEGGPRNSDGTYSGNITVRTAVAKSKNVIAWKLFEELTPSVGLSYLLDMRFKKIVANDYYPASSLGGLTNGASPVEMASGYATLANEGVYREPTCIKKITDAEGIEVAGPLDTSKRVYKKEAANTMTDVMTTVMESGTGRNFKLQNMNCAGKTGTTNDKKDGWFCGYTPYYTTSVWVGCDQPQTISDLYGSTYPGQIWKMFMETIHEGLENKAFPTYAGKTEEKVYKEDDAEDDKPMETEEVEETAEPTEDVNEDDEDEEVDDKKDKPSEKPIEAVPTEPPIIEATDEPVAPDPVEIPDPPEEPEPEPEEESVG